MSDSNDGTARRSAERGGLAPAAWSRLLSGWHVMSATVISGLLVVAGIVSPWIEVFRKGDLDIPTQAYSPWTVLQRRGFEGAGIIIIIYFLAVIVLMASSLVMVRTRNTYAKSTATGVTVTVATAGIAVTCFTLISAPIGLALSYPYYDTNILYGGWLTLAGFVGLLSIALGELLA